MKQYPPPAVAALLVLVLGLAPIASCADHAHSHIAFASGAHEESVATPAPLSIAASPVPVNAPAVANDARVILVTIDGVRAEDVFEGANPSLRPGTKVDAYRTPEAVMPRLHRLAATRGVAIGADQPGCGVARTASGMNVSLPGYLEIFTGRKTRCRDNQCARVEMPTVLDEAANAGLSPVASIGSWDILDRAVSKGGASVFVAEGAQRWPGQRPLVVGNLEQLVEAGEQTEAFPGVGKYRPDALTSAIALEYFRTTAPRVFHVGLGDADEWGHRNDYGAYLEAVGKADAFIGQLSDTLDAMGDRGAHTTVIVTTDHGRNKDFQHHGAFSFTSARTFVVAFGARVPVRGIACATHDVSLADIAPTMRALLGLPADSSQDAGRPIEEILPSSSAGSDHLVAGAAAGATGAAGSGSGVGRLQRP